jgi:hypothetical protein
MFTSEKTTVSREGRRVRSFQNDVFSCIDKRFLFLGMTSPEEKYQKISFV